MRYDLLEMLAKKLDDWPVKRFNMSTYFSKSRDWYSSGINIHAFKNECGTAACGAGIAMTMPEFVELGLSYTVTAWGASIPEYKGATSFDALKRLFEIPNMGEVEYLFSEHAHSIKGVALRDDVGGFKSRHLDTPKRLARRIRKLIEHDKKREARLTKG